MHMMIVHSVLFIRTGLSLCKDESQIFAGKAEHSHMQPETNSSMLCVLRLIHQP